MVRGGPRYAGCASDENPRAGNVETAEELKIHFFVACFHQSRDHALERVDVALQRRATALVSAYTGHKAVHERESSIDPARKPLDRGSIDHEARRTDTSRIEPVEQSAKNLVYALGVDVLKDSI